MPHFVTSPFFHHFHLRSHLSLDDITHPTGSGKEILSFTILGSLLLKGKAPSTHSLNGSQGEGSPAGGQRTFGIDGLGSCRKDSRDKFNKAQ